MKSNYFPISPKSGVQGLFEEKTERLLMGVISSIPASILKESAQPRDTAELLIHKACVASAWQSGTLAIPAGPFSLLTLIPDLVNIWRIQSQLVADIAATYGKFGFLGREEMAWCLFRHAASQVARDFLVKTGQRALMSGFGKKALTALLRKVGARSAEKLSGRVILRMVPLLGIAICGGYAYYDTKKVGQAAIELFSNPKISI
jgi:hypothetical protein